MLILDIDKDGVNDFVIAGWSEGTSMVWFRHTPKRLTGTPAGGYLVKQGHVQGKLFRGLKNLDRRLKASVCQAKRITGFIWGLSSVLYYSRHRRPVQHLRPKAEEYI